MAVFAAYDDLESGAAPAGGVRGERARPSLDEYPISAKPLYNVPPSSASWRRRRPWRYLSLLTYLSVMLLITCLDFWLYLVARGAAGLPTSDGDSWWRSLWSSQPRGNSGGSDPLNPYPDGRRLLFDKNGQFKLVVFSDLHFGERGTNNSWAQWAEEADEKSQKVMTRCLDEEHPNLVVFNGDQITGENQLWENATLHLDNVYAPVLAHRTSFASIYGNHDESYNISHRASFEYETGRAKARALSWTQENRDSADDPKGQFNYYIPVYPDAHTRIPALLLWFFDSRSGVFNSPQFGVKDEPWMSQDWVDPRAAAWLNATAARMRATWGALPPSLVHVHIPPKAAGTIAAQAVVPHPEAYPGIDFDEPPDTQGDRSDFWHRPEPDAPFWTAVTRTLGGADGTGLLAVVSGHDHGNAWCARTDEVGPYSFCFARHTGYGGYGTWTRGSRVFRADLGRGKGTKKGRGGGLETVRTWVRLEDGTTANTTTLAQDGRAVLLNSRDPAPE